MKQGAVVVDVAIDQGGCFETSHATTHADPTFVVDGVVHYCVANMPGAVARTSTFALNNATIGHALAHRRQGLETGRARRPAPAQRPQRGARAGDARSSGAQPGLRLRRSVAAAGLMRLMQADPATAAAAASIVELAAADLRLHVDPAALGFADTSELLQQPLPWIGQERAEQAARFGLQMEQPDYNLFVLGEVGSGRTSLMNQMMDREAAARPVPPDLCYLHNFEVPEQPRSRCACRPARGACCASGWRTSPRRCRPRSRSGCWRRTSQAESERIESAYKAEEDSAYAELSAFAEARNFGLMRDQGRMVFTQRDENGRAPDRRQGHGADPRAARRARRRRERSCAPRSAASWRRTRARETGDEGGAGGPAAPDASSRCSTMHCRRSATGCASRSRTRSSWASTSTRRSRTCWRTWSCSSPATSTKRCASRR